jgi:hypothetical protein
MKLIQLLLGFDVSARRGLQMGDLPLDILNVSFGFGGGVHE